ncbi:MAG: hypothetical protein KDH88_07325 [Chromatiales bacterium]|nr:hypothetical protein [Chromatiales bacterium]
MTLQVAAAGFVLLALISVVVAVRRLRRGKLVRAGGWSGAAVLSLAAAMLFGSIASNLYTYSRLTAEQPVGEVNFRSLGPQQFLARLRLEDGRALDLELLGDEWQLDARVLKWTGPATLLGFDTLYRLERISGRYRKLDEERNGSRSVHSLATAQGLDLWDFLHDSPMKVPWMDALYGSATYLPMADGARYRISLSNTGLLTRALNDSAASAVRGWK